MFHALRAPASALFAAVTFVSPLAHPQVTPEPQHRAMSVRPENLPTAPEPQAQSTSQGPQQQQSAPTLDDLGITPQQQRADRDAQKRLDQRSHDLKVHQTFGLITLAPIAAACLSSGLAPADPRGSNNEAGRDLHIALGATSVAMYSATAWYAIKAPRIPGQGPTKGGIKLHKYLVAIHAPGMVLTPILGAMAYNQASKGEKVTGIASAHGAVALITAGAYAASIVAVSWPIHVPGFHRNQGQATAQAAGGAE